jgi:hypothetical protein
VCLSSACRLRCRCSAATAISGSATVRRDRTVVGFSSTTRASPTMVKPSSSWSSPIPRGLVQAPQSQTFPLLA